MKKSFLAVLALFFIQILSFAQPATTLVKVIVGLNHADWQYKIGENAAFTIQVLQNGSPVIGAEVAYQYGLEKMEPTKKSVFETTSQNAVIINAGTLKEPGFLRLIATVKINGKEYRGLATAGFEPENLEPVVELPTDFNEFWDKAKTDLAKIPMDAKMTLLPERCTEKVNVYHLNLQNYKEGARLYGILCIPKKEGKYPAILHVPGAGTRGYYGDVKNAEMGIITLQIGIHGIPVTMEPSVYTDLTAGWNNQYWTYNMDDRDKYYYKRV
jgi:cephalosporin-C deacetylase